MTIPTGLEAIEAALNIGDRATDHWKAARAALADMRVLVALANNVECCAPVSAGMRCECGFVAAIHKLGVGGT